MPTVTPTDTRFWPVLVATKAALDAALAANPNPPAHSSIRPGIIPPEDLSGLSDLCCEGAAWVREVVAFPTAAFPTPLEAANRLCSDPPSYGITVEMGVYRCVAMGSVSEMITDDDWTQAVTQVTNDQEAMRIAARVMQQEAPFGYPGITWALNQSFVMGNWEPVESEGGCCGGTQQFTIQVFCPE